MAQMTGHPLLGVVENMAYFVCPSCAEKHFIFGRGGAIEIAHAMQVPLLARIPLDTQTRQGGDTGVPAALHHETAVGAAFDDIARAVLAHSALTSGSGNANPARDADGASREQRDRATPMGPEPSSAESTEAD